MNKVKSSLALNLYARLIPVQLLSKVTSSLCTVITTLVISYSLGEMGLSQYKVVEAFSNFVVIFALLISAGEILLMSRAICKGEKEKVNRIFTSVTFLSFAVSAVIAICCIFFGEAICTFFGADSSMVTECRSVLVCAIPYYFALPLCSVFISMLQMKSSFKIPVISSVIVFTLTSLLNYLFLSVLKQEIHFATISLSTAQVVSLVFLLICNRRKKTETFSIKSIYFPMVALLVSAGFTETAVSVFSAVKNSVFVKIASAVGGVEALSVSSRVFSVDAVSFGIFGSIFPLVTLMIAGIYVNEGDRDSLRRFMKTAYCLGIGIAVILSMFMFFSAYPVARIYNVENVATYVKSQRIFAFAFLFYMPYILTVTLFAVLEKKKTVNILSAFTAFIVPLGMILLFGRLFGIPGLFMGMVAGDFSSVVILLVYITVVNGHFPRSIDEILCLDRDFGVSREDTFSVRIEKTEDAVNASKQIMDFCKSKNIDRRTSYISGLCLEEIVVNVVEHGFRKTKGKGICELVCVNMPDALKLVVRDNCVEFDITEKLKAYDEADIAKGVGIRIVTGTAEVSYKNMYGLNILTMTVKK